MGEDSLNRGQTPVYLLLLLLPPFCLFPTWNAEVTAGATVATLDHEVACTMESTRQERCVSQQCPTGPPSLPTDISLTYVLAVHHSHVHSPPLGSKLHGGRSFQAILFTGGSPAPITVPGIQQAVHLLSKRMKSMACSLSLTSANKPMKYFFGVKTIWIAFSVTCTPKS